MQQADAAETPTTTGIAAVIALPAATAVTRTQVMAATAALVETAATVRVAAAVLVRRVEEVLPDRAAQVEKGVIHKTHLIHAVRGVAVALMEERMERMPAGRLRV